MKRRNVAYLGIRGSQQFPRFVITEAAGTVWTGKTWSKSQKKALLFAHAGEASRVSQEVMRQQYADLHRVERFTVLINVEVRSKDGIDRDELREWLLRAVQCNLAYGTFGTGPTKDSLALLNISFYDLKPFVNTDEEKGKSK